MSPIIKTNIPNAEFLTQLDALYQRELPHLQSSLWHAASYHFKNPGKAFRAQLAYTSGTAFGSEQQDNLHWAAACELLHNASLIHDDISDASTHRRGQPSINQRFGADMALCLGDWMVAKAFELAARNREHGAILVGLLAKAMQETCSGQMSDISQRQCASIDQWKCIASGKTSPLLIAPIKGAALAAGMDGQLTSLEQLVNLCGLVYQGRNDIDDIVPSSHRSSDLDGRKPNLVISLFSDSDVGNNDFLTWYRSDNTSRVGNWQRRIAASDAIFQAHHSIEYWLEKAIQLVPIIPDQLQDVAHALIISVQHRAVVKQQGQIA